jgi:cysteine synthase
MLQLPTYDDVAAAARRLQGQAHRTPVLRSSTANRLLKAEVFFKCENLQRMGAFKFRGAFNALSKFTPAQREAGVIAFSSGNHAQAIALSARLLGIPATILMPLDAPQAKIDATRGYGGEVILFDRYTQDREQLTAKVANERALTVIPPYDHPDVLAGQGTAARELFEELGPLDVLLVPLGGGGLLSGSALATRALAPDCKLYGVEPERRPAIVPKRRDRSHRDAADAGRRCADATPGQVHVRDHPAGCRRHPHRDRCAAGRGNALFRRAHEDGRRADGLPRLRGRLPCRSVPRRQAGGRDPERRQRRLEALRAADRLIGPLGASSYNRAHAILAAQGHPTRWQTIR